MASGSPAATALMLGGLMSVGYNAPMASTCKDNVLAALERAKGSFVSGGMLAGEFGVSRNAVWKAVAALKAGGYDIESITGKGYRLNASSSILSAASIERYLTCPDVTVEYHDSIDSTNTRAKALAEQGACEGTLVVANQQSAGRGRQGRPFVSPKGTGVYFSLLLRPDFALEDLSLVTSYAACCVARSIEGVFNKAAQIKWVNDIFVNGHKVCGILTEASFDAESSRVSYAVVGIGINVYQPQGGFPEDAGSIAHGIVEGASDSGDARARIVGLTISSFMEGYGAVPTQSHLEDYRKRSLLDGKTVDIYRGQEKLRARVIGVNDDFTLEVERDDGVREALSSGEVHIPSSQL